MIRYLPGLYIEPNLIAGFHLVHDVQKDEWSLYIILTNSTKILGRNFTSKSGATDALARVIAMHERNNV